MDMYPGFPRQILANSRPRAQTYKLMPDYYAIHGQQPGLPAPDAAYLLNEGRIAIFKGSPDQAKVPASHKLSPVYELVPGGSPAVPTGLVFIRFADGVTVGEREGAIKSAGYEVAEILGYAPNAAWLRARSGNIADALSGVETLAKLPDVESVEPQMLMEAVRR